ncbi:MAG: SCO family protein [Candidatus Rokubacteria bacterium]|nr:SCO family protein [Candidatus Rokubacteria bacterium]
MRLVSHPLFAPILVAAVFLWGAALAAFLLVAPSLKTPWMDTLLVFCFGFNPAGRVYRLDTLILYLLQPPLFVVVVGFFYGAELREFLQRRAGQAVAVAAPLLFLSLSAFVVATSEVSASGTPLSPGTVGAPLRQGTPAPALGLTDHRGRPFTLAEQRGKVVAVTFFYANCHASCPILLSRLRALEARVPGDDLVLVAVTLDPSRDGVAELAAHAERWSLGPRWHLVTGPPGAVAAVLKAYGVQARPLPDGEIAHENVIQLIDRRGRLGFVYRGLGHPEEQLAQGLRVLIEDRG